MLIFLKLGEFIDFVFLDLIKLIYYGVSFFVVWLLLVLFVLFGCFFVKLDVLL